ncbi:lipocalin family protein [Arundinibacter roseus]|uniref:Lipocalin-like domain-containing protein n=1 Tax=Arundinibacter roseus TaxID=2070510 RepID=A0A4R4K121_9BACT|nr:lipocalin family protein [Arundinibacter roseus]TDB60021.1 hypothetical protein EZE20_21345 [Arundinibacter roseus]
MRRIPFHIRQAFVYVGGLAATICLFFVLVSSTASPDQLIVGTWEEVTWKYEKVDKSQDDSIFSGEEISETLKNQIAKNLIIHQSEKWRFRKDGTLQLSSRQKPDKTIHWTMKGRGHVLVMQHNQTVEESYDIAKLTDKELVLHFHTQMQARGIAKITFKKIR